MFCCSFYLFIILVLWSWGLKSHYVAQSSLGLFLPKRGLPGVKCQAWLFLQVVSYFVFLDGYNYREQYFHVKMAT